MTTTAPARLRVVEPGTPPPEPARSAEVGALAAVQRAIGRPPVVRAARGLSHFGEHAMGWLAIGLVGAVVDRDRGRDWLTGAAGVAAAHAASIAVKRVVRRQRPIDESVEVLVKTPSSLSFPSSHATSTTAAAVVYSGLTGRNLVPVLVPPMLVSRLVLGVHYPTDVLAGATLGAAVGGVVRRVLRKRAR
jgi:membrane-associated phospholipid phosphatase